ncbi:VOC family protein [Salipiger sp. IMCC34102]|uniref:VOC family protein n=1 Tax=Salipiger sp. IMCC34102 TaxID=2510647 RepID=UPI00101D9409|nr:VOC family protein [Salipiger sp. IMCC34102]RYH04356.1 VOC family protein [Salipiger sp. IMCC34102]
MTDDPHHTLDYVEYTSPDLDRTKDFMAAAFGWSFVDYGPDYADIQGAGIGGGVERGAGRAPLPVVRSTDLDASYAAVKAAGGEITRGIFSFPGGRRFQFREPGGTEMAVWITAD